jgi:diguanylate cyclase (GGDEF)-like protein
MTIGLDVRTMIFVTAMVTIIIAIGMFAISRMYPRLRAARFWAAGCALQTVGWVLFDLRSHAPGFITVVFGNLLPLCSIAFFNAAFAEYSGIPFPRRAAIVFFSMVAALQAFFYGVAPSLPARMATFSLAALALTALCVQTLLRPDGKCVPVSRRLAAGLLCGNCVFLGIRALLILMGIDLPTSVFSNDLIAAVTYTGVNATNILMTFGFLCMCHERQSEEVLRLASLDALTGIGNRRAMEQVMAEELRRAYADNMPLSVLLLDMDHFKRVNDTFGHSVGDRALQAAAAAIQFHTRSGDTAARWGGEEFLIALPGTSLLQATQVAERIRAEIRRSDLTTEGCRVALSASIGVAYSYGDESDFGPLLNRADANLYASKVAGRNRVTSAPNREPVAA